MILAFLSGLLSNFTGWGRRKMKTLIAICVIVLSAAAAAAAKDSDPWLGIFKSEDGFLFQGHLERTPFSFNIPGDRINVAQQEGSDDSTARTLIDDMFFSVASVRKSEFPKANPDILISYRNWEQQYEKEQLDGVVLSDLDVCKSAPLRHESWEMRPRNIKAPPQVFMATEVGNYILVIGSAFAHADDREKVLSKFSQLCKTFKRGQTK